MLMNTIKPYYIVKTTLTYTFFIKKNKAESSPPPPLSEKISPTPRSPYLFGRSWHPFLANSIEICFFYFFHRLSISVLNNW